MTRGFCFKCNRQIGGFLNPPAWQCPGCRKLYCDTCPKKRVGRFFKRPTCPECRIELRGG